MSVADVVARLRQARRVLFITGAGLSADSGLPTYRGVGGLYEGVGTEDGIPIEEALSGAMMKARPAVCWRHILEIERACRGATPNAGHRVIADLEKRVEVVVLTQNVDGLHRAAGSSAVIDIHGDVRRLMCTRCDHERTVEDYADLELEQVGESAGAPMCPACGAVVRPDVVLFGEMLPMHKVARLQTELSDGFDVVFSVGTSSLFPYIAQPMILGRRQGALTVEINPAATVVSDAAEIRLEMGGADALVAIASAL